MWGNGTCTVDPNDVTNVMQFLYDVMQFLDDVIPCHLQFIKDNVSAYSLL